MKPYKIIKPEKALHWNGYFEWGIGLYAPKNKPKIPLVFFSQVHPLTEERERWLKLRVKIVTVENDKERNPVFVSESIRVVESKSTGPSKDSVSSNR